MRLIYSNTLCIVALCTIFAVSVAITVPYVPPITGLGPFKVMQNMVSVSGISSGACMAHQFHVAYSSSIMGAGIISGAPYWCAESDVAVALSSCMQYPDFIVTQTLLGAVNYAYLTGTLDNPVYLKNSKVFIFHGTQDNEVVLGVSEKVNDFYNHYLPASNIKMNLSIPAAHAFVTNNYGNPCDFFGEPYMNNCHFDTAYHVLSWIYGDLKPAVRNWNASNLVSIDQSAFVPFPWTIAEISMARLGYAYIPTACKNRDTACALHVAFHGCLQNVDSISFTFINHSGYNEWAEANNIIIIYPQTIVSPTLPYNPKGCWDWWGYTGPEYASKLSPQMQVVRGMIRSFTVI